jgi:hypothetical protein
LYNLRARQYDASNGDFLTPDPIAQPLKNPYSSTYSYAMNQPTVLTDPSGMDSDPGQGDACASVWCWAKSGGPFTNPGKAPDYSVVGESFTDFGDVATGFIAGESACYIAGAVLAPETGGAALVGAAAVCGAGGVIEVHEIRERLQNSRR